MNEADIKVLLASYERAIGTDPEARSLALRALRAMVDERLRAGMTAGAPDNTDAALARVADLEARLDMRELQLRSRDRMRETIVAVLVKHGELGESRADDVVASAVEVVVDAWEVTRDRVAELEREREWLLMYAARVEPTP